jgi:hypothetical protein
MKHLTAARDAVGSEEPIATGGWSFCTVLSFWSRVPKGELRAFETAAQTRNLEPETQGLETRNQDRKQN